MMKTVHVIDPAFQSRGKMQLMKCRECEAETLHTTPFFVYPFRCVANHSSTSRCDCCKIYVDHIAKVVVNSEGECERFCDLCSEPDSPEKDDKIAERKRKAAEDALKPLDLNDSHSIARALRASSFTSR